MKEGILQAGFILNGSSIVEEAVKNLIRHRVNVENDKSALASLKVPTDNVASH